MTTRNNQANLVLLEKIKTKLILLFGLILIPCAFLFGGCNYDDSVSVIPEGKYYLVGSETVYVEILPNNKIELVGLDYSEDVAIYENLGYTVDFAANLQGIKDYEFDSENMKVIVALFDEPVEQQIRIKFTYSSNKLTRRNQDYILNIENN